MCKKPKSPPFRTIYIYCNIYITIYIYCTIYILWSKLCFQLLYFQDLIPEKTDIVDPTVGITAGICPNFGSHCIALHWHSLSLSFRACYALGWHLVAFGQILCWRALSDGVWVAHWHCHWQNLQFCNAPAISGWESIIGGSLSCTMALSQFHQPTCNWKWGGEPVS